MQAKLAFERFGKDPWFAFEEAAVMESHRRKVRARVNRVALGIMLACAVLSLVASRGRAT
jgi:hypothetical protein